MESITHPFLPLYDENSRTLILGSFPSVRSREAMFFYGHPQNRFWRVIAAVFGEETPVTVEEKKGLILRNGLALWDTIHSCTIEGSSDSSIKDAVPNNISGIIDKSRIDIIFCNGTLSHKLYMKYIFPDTGVAAVRLPSTSPANAAYSPERLIAEWSVIRR